MPHNRNRYLAHVIRKSLSAFPIVGVFGQRQVGKTTLAGALSGEYLTLDIRQNLELCEANPAAFLKNRNVPFVIDESQMSPALFPALKEHVRALPKPGQFLITGSVRFSNRKLIRESLTGRIAMHELLPMSITEAHSEPLNDLPQKALESLASGKIHKLLAHAKKLETSRKDSVWQKRVAQFLKTGGLPGVCFSHSLDLRHQKWESYLETILLRDLQLILKTTLSYGTLRNALVQIALKQGEPLQIATFARLVGISAITAKKLLMALQGLFLIREIQPLDSPAHAFYDFEDQGLAYHLSPGLDSPPLNTRRVLLGNIRAQFVYRGSAQFFCHQTRGGAFLPLVCQAPQGLVAYTATSEESPTPQTLRSAESFLKKHKRAMAFIGHAGNETRVWNSRLLSLPFRFLL